MVVLTGPSGGGKSTAAMGLAGLLGDAVHGEMTGHVSVEGPSDGRVSLVQQDPDSHLVTLTVEDEVAFGPENLALPRDEIIRRVQEALEAVHALHLVHRSTNELSGGEKQRVAIASVLAMAPDVLVLDEPSANLDPQGRRDVLDLAVELLKDGDRALVVTEHRLERLAKAAMETVVLDGGRVRWRGTFGQMQSEAEALAASGLRVPGRPDLLGIDREEATPGETVLDVRGLQSGYGETQVLHGIDLTVREREVVGLVGPNGAGKTTLLRCILGLGEVWDGRVLVAGLDAGREPTSKMAREAGLVFQTPDHQLFERTVREELTFGPRNFGIDPLRMEDRIGELAAEYALAPLMEVHPYRLSLGQKRRLNVASVQASFPRLLMLDEPFIGQDLGNIRALNRAIQEARWENTAILMVSHDLEVLSHMCDRAVVVDGGRSREVDDPVSLEGGPTWGDGP
jgi:energy-coupling factor transporter ATP-binding protein EcfA2